MQLSGEIILLAALFFAVLQSILPFIGYQLKNPYLLASARPLALAQIFFVMNAYLFLTYAFITNDFSLAYVAANSHALLPFMYRLTAVWGAHEGSILLWITILAGWTFVVTLLDRKNPIYPLILAVLGIISAGFLIFLLFTSNPFLMTTDISSGQDLNPLLQDPGFVIHPPMLYIGYVGLSVAFAITQAALIHGKLDTAWARLTKRFTLLAWAFLTLGITLGSWWAYRVLGWGGFWFWDPVENASLLPWLASTALIHVLVLAEKRNLAQNFAALLTIICFALSILGTFLVRSGLLISAHTFANDPARGLALLILFIFLMTIALSIFVTSTPRTTSSTPLKWVSREMSLLLNSTFLLIMMSTILLGTLYPIFLEALHLGTISVGAPYFNTILLPLVFATMFTMGMAAFTRWQDDKAPFVLKMILQKWLISLLIGFTTVFLLHQQFQFLAMLNVTLSCFIVLSVLTTFRALPGMAIAHAGVAILMMGILLSGFLNEEREVRIQPGSEVALGPYQFHFLKTERADGSNYRGIRAQFAVTKNKRFITNMYPEKRLYDVRQMVMSHVAIHPSIFRDLYLALGDPFADDSWSVRLYYKPFIRWIWFGGLLMMLGGLLAIFKKRKYVT